MVIRWISRLISERKRRELSKEFYRLFETIQLLVNYELEALDEVKKYSTLMKLYDESEPEYLEYKREHDWMLERALEYNREVERRRMRMKRLQRRMDRMSE